MSSSDQRGERRDQRRGLSPKVIGGIVAFVLLVWFIAANSQQVDVTLWVLNTQTSLVVVIILSALLGAGITYFFTRIRRPHRDDRDGNTSR